MISDKKSKKRSSKKGKDNKNENHSAAYNKAKNGHLPCEDLT